MIRDVPTFDPYAYREFSVGDVARCAARGSRSDAAAYLALGALATAPAVLFPFTSVTANAALYALTVVLLIATVAPTVARRGRGLSADLPGTIRTVLRALPAVLLAGFVTATALVPAVLVAPQGPLGMPGPLGVLSIALALGGGVALAAPFALAVPVVVLEGLGVRASLRRSLTLVRPRALKALPPLLLVVIAAALPEAVRNVAPALATLTIVAQPVLAALSAVGFGALYIQLHDR